MTDALGHPVSGVEVRWEAVSPGGTLPASNSTGADGTATAGWTLGVTAGEHAADAFVAGSGARSGAASLPGAAAGAGTGSGAGADSDELRVRFHATGVAGEPARFLRVSGDGQSGAVGAELPDPLVVAVEDEHGNPRAGAAVMWRVVQGGGALTTGSALTGEDGRARAEWRLGTAVGTGIAAASLDGHGDVTFTSTAVAGPPHELLGLGGNGQIAVAGSLLPDSLVVRAVDAWGNPVPAAPIAWSVIEGGGFVVGAANVTANDGTARAAFVLGTDEPWHRARAEVPGVAAVTFIASGTAAPRRIVLFGDSNLEGGWEGRTPTVRARSYVSSRQHGLNLGPYEPHHPAQLAAKVEAEWARRHSAPLAAVNHAIGGTGTGGANIRTVSPNARQAVNGVERFRAEVLGQGYPWNGGESGSGFPDGPVERVRAFTPGPDDFVLVSMGTNDPNMGLSPTDTRDNVRWMIHRWKDAGLPPRNLVITTLPPAPKNGTSYPRINELLRALAVQEGVGLIDLARHVSDDDGLTWKSPDLHLEGDSIHYAEAVRQWLAERMVERMEEAILQGAMAATP